MAKYIETKIIEINDPDFQTLITELCDSVRMSDEGIENMTMANLFSAFVRGEKKMNLQNLPIEQILSKKVKDLALDSVVHDVCRELASAKEKSMDDFAGRTVFALIKQCYKAVNPLPSRIKKPTRLQSKHQFDTNLIKRRRSNGSFY